MTDAMTPYSFIPGTKARAEEINANFEALISAIKDVNEVFNEELQKFADTKTDKTESDAGLETKADLNLENTDENLDYVVESWNSGANWYRKYRSGWIEQGGIYDSGSIQANFSTTVNFYIPFVSIPVNINGIANRGDDVITSSDGSVSIGAITNTTVSLFSRRISASGGARYIIWEAKGY